MFYLFHEAVYRVLQIMPSLLLISPPEITRIIDVISIKKTPKNPRPALTLILQRNPIILQPNLFLVFIKNTPGLPQYR